MVKPQRGLSAIRPYVPGKPIEEVQREYGLTDIIKLASNENPIGASPVVVQALMEALPQLNVYPDAQAYRLRHALAAHHRVDPEMIRVGNGADGVIRELCVSYLNDDDEVLTSCSSFPVYDISAAVMRARLVKTSLTPDLRFDLHAMAGAITPRTRLIFVCNPNNPTGSIVTAGEVAEFMRRVPDNAIVVFDEAYFEFVDYPHYPDSMAYILEGQKNVCILRTFSKAYGIAGIRMGYAIASAELLAPMRSCAESFPVNLLAQIAGLAALKRQRVPEAHGSSQRRRPRVSLSRIRSAGHAVRSQPDQLPARPRRSRGEAGLHGAPEARCHRPPLHRLRPAGVSPHYRRRPEPERASRRDPRSCSSRVEGCRSIDLCPLPSRSRKGERGRGMLRLAARRGVLEFELTEITFALNGAVARVDVDPAKPLLDVLRNELG